MFILVYKFKKRETIMTIEQKNIFPTLAYIVVIIVGLKLGSSIILPFLTAFFLFIIFLPFINILSKYSIPNVISTLIILFILIMALFLFSSYFLSTNQDIIQNLNMYQNKYQEIMPKIISFLEQFNISFEWNSVIKAVEPGKLIQCITGFFNNMRNILLDISLTILLLLFLLLESDTISKKISHFIKTQEGKNKLDTFFKSINRYFLIKTFTSLLTGFLIWILLSYFELPHAFFFALLTFLLNYIPSIGSFIAAFFAIFVSLLQLTLIDTAIISLGYVIVNVVVGNIIDPKIMGNRLNLSTFVVFSSMVLWGWIFGFLGMLLSVPLTMAISLACENTGKYHWVSILLKDNLSKEDLKESDIEKRGAN